MRSVRDEMQNAVQNQQGAATRAAVMANQHTGGMARAPQAVFSQGVWWIVIKLRALFIIFGKLLVVPWVL
jgi:hypothetical protein